MVTTLQKSSFTKRNIRTIISDPEKTANAVNLVYLRDTQPGIKKVKHGRDSIYVHKNKPVKIRRYFPVSRASSFHQPGKM